MIHKTFGKKLNRNHHERQALLKSLVKSVFTYGTIKTTQAKSKAVLPLIEKIASLFISADIAKRRELFKYFQSRKQIMHIETVMTGVFAGHTNQFFKVQKLFKRQGDDATIVKISFVNPIDFKQKPVVKEKVVKVKNKPKKNEK